MKRISLFAGKFHASQNRSLASQRHRGKPGRLAPPTRKTTEFKSLVLLAAGLALSPMALQAQTVEKVADLVTGASGGTGYGPSIPQCRFTLVGSNLWFTSQNGGAAGFGGVFSFNPDTGEVLQLATLDNTSGNRPWASSLVLAAGKAWFTTSRGGTGDKGSLVSIETNAPYALANVFSFPTTPEYGWSPHSTPIQIGDDLWFTTSSGGTPPGGATVNGTIVKYSLTGQTLTNVLSLDTPISGRQPLGSGLVAVGDAYYYLTFAGGTNTVAPTPNGAGILGRLTFDTLHQPIITKVLDLPGKFVSSPAGDVIPDGTNLLYFTTVGTATNPGAIVRFDVAKAELTTLFTFVTNAVAATNYGKQPYGTPVLYNHELYFTTLAGGTVGKGVLAKLNLADHTVTKLADFEQSAGLALGASPQYNGGTLYTNPVTGRIATYWPINRGGLNNLPLGNGTIVRVDLPPPPIVTTVSNTVAGDLVLSWTGGYTPYSIDHKHGLADPEWTTNWIAGLTTHAISLSVTGAQEFFRVGSTNQ